uniref:glutathione transferase n=1 Tax=Leersia perrieri TaxID=77586 RepID=A0A0D9XG85_9ORYZ
MAGLGTGAPIVKLYHEKSMILPDVSRVLACLHEKNINFEIETASYKSLLRLQASSHAPVPFYDGPIFLEESREICRYVAETYEHHGYPFLLGKDALERASIEQWLHHEEHTFNPPSQALFCHLAFPMDDEDDNIQMQKAKLEEVLEVYEQRLSDSEFLAGNKFTLADLVHLPNSHYITSSSEFVKLYDSRKNVQRWWNSISARKSWQDVLTYMTKVEQQHKSEELEKQKQQDWQREHRSATRRRIPLDLRKDTGTRPQTVLVPPPPGTFSASTMAPQAEQPPPADNLSEKAPVSSSQSTTHKSLTFPSKLTTLYSTHQEIPPDSAQSTQRTSSSSTPSLGTFPTTSDKPPRIHADQSSIRDVSVPSDTTKTDLPTRPMLSLSKGVGTYIEPTPQKILALLDNSSESDVPSSGVSHSQAGPGAAKEDSDRLNVSDLYGSHRKSTGVYSEENESISYTDNSSNKLRSTEAHQMLQAKQWHTATAGLRNLQGDIDNSTPSRQVKPSKDVQQYPLQDSEQASINPVAQEPKSMKDQLVRGPEIIAQTPYTDQTRDVSSRHWRHAAAARGISKDEESSDRRRQDAYLAEHSIEDDDSQDTAPRATEDSTAPRGTMDHDAYDTSQGIKSYDSAPSRLQPMDASHDAPLASAKSTNESSRTATPIPTGYQCAQDFIQQVRVRPKQRPVVPYDAQSSTKEEKMVESPPSKTQMSGYHGPDFSLPKEVLNENGYDVNVPFQSRYSDDKDNWKHARDTTTSKPQDTAEETKTSDSESFEAQTLYSQQAIQRKKPPAEDPYFPASTFKKRYFVDQDSTKESKQTASRPRVEAQDSLEETKADESALPREQPSDILQAASPPSRQAEGKDARISTPLFQEGYADSQVASKQHRDSDSISRRKTAQDARVTFVESKPADSTSARQWSSDDWQDEGSLPMHKVYDSRGSTVPFQETTMKSEDTGRQQMRGQGTKETKLFDSASPQVEPLDYQRSDSHLQKHGEIEDPHDTISLPKKTYTDVEDITKRPGDKMLGEGAQDGSEETKAIESVMFRTREQPQDTHHAAITPLKQAAAKDSLGVTPLSPTRYPTSEDTSMRPRRIASTPTEKSVQDGRDAFRESKRVDSTSSREQLSDVTRSAASLPKQQAADSRSTTMPFQRRYPDIEDNTKKPRDRPKEMVGEDSQDGSKETKALDFAIYRDRAQPQDTQRAAITPLKQAATKDALGVPPLSPTRYSTTEDTIRQTRETASKPTTRAVQDGRDGFREPRSVDSTSSRDQSSDVQRAVAPLPKQEAADSHSTNMYLDIEDAAKEPRDKPKETVGEDAQDRYKETKTGYPTIVTSKAQPQDTQQAASTPLEQAAARNALGVTPISTTRYPTSEGTSRKPRRTASTPTEKAVQDGRDAFRELKSLDSTSSREQPLDVRQAAASFPKQESTDSHGTTMPFQWRYPDIEDTTKEPRDTPKETVGEDAQDTSEETTALGSEIFRGRAQLQDTQRAATTPSKQVAAKDSLGVTPLSPTRYPTPENTSKQTREIASKSTGTTVQDGRDAFIEPRSVYSTSSRDQSSDVQRAAAPLPKQESADSHSKTMTFQRSYPDIENTTKELRDKPKEKVVEDVQDRSKETKALDSTVLRSKAQPQDTQQAQPQDSTSSREQPLDVWQAAASLPYQESIDSHSKTMPFQRRYPDTEDTTKEPRAPIRYPTSKDTSRQPRRTASTSTEKAVQDGRDAFKELKSVDSTSSREQPLDVWQAAASLPKQESADSRSTTMAFQRRYPDIEDTSKEPRDKPKEMVGQGAQNTSEGTFEETKAADSKLLREQSSDTWQDRTTPLEQAVTRDGLNVSPSKKESISDEDSSKKPRGTGSMPQRIAARDDNGAFEESNPDNSVSSKLQPLNAWQLSVPPPRQEIKDFPSTAAPFQKRYPEDNTKKAGYSASAPTHIADKGAKHDFEDTTFDDSASSSKKTSDTQQAAFPLSNQVEAQDTLDGGKKSIDTWDKGRESRETISAPNEMVARDILDMSGKIKTDDFKSRGQSPEGLQASSQSRQVVPENAYGATKGAKVSFTDETIQSPDVKDTTRKSRASEETRGPVSTLDRVQPFGFHDTQHANEESKRPAADQRDDVSTQFQSDAQDNSKEIKSSFTDERGMGPKHSQAEPGRNAQAIIREKIFSTESLRDMLKESEGSTSAAAGQRIDSVVKKTRSADQKGSTAVQDRHGQDRTLPADGKADDSTPKLQLPPGSPSASHEKQTAPVPPREIFRDDYGTEYPMRRDIVDDQKEVTPLSNQEPTSQAQQASETSQEAAPDEDESMKLSLDQWWRTSKPLQGVTPISGDDVTGLSTDDQMPTPMSQETIPSAQVANGITKRSVKQTEEPPAPVVSQTILRQQARPSAPITREAPIPDNEGAMSKIQEVSSDSHPTDYPAVPSVPTQGQVPHAPQTSPGQEGITPAQGEMDSSLSDAQSSSEKFQQPAPDESTKPFISSEKHGSHFGPKLEHKSTPSEPIPSVGSRSEEAAVDEAEQIKPPQKFMGHQDIRHAPGISGITPDDKLNEETVSTQGQVYNAPFDSQPHDGSPPNVHSASVEENTTIPLSQAQRSDERRDSMPTHLDVKASSDDQSTTKSITVKEAQQQQLPAKIEPPPPLFETVNYFDETLDKSKPSEPSSFDKEVMPPKLVPPSARDPRHVTVPDGVTPDEHKNIMADLTPRQRSLPAEPTKEETVVDASDETKASQTIIGQRDISPAVSKEKYPSSDVQNDPMKVQEVASEDQRINQSFPSQDQAPNIEPTPGTRDGAFSDSRGTVFEEPITHITGMTSTPDIQHDQDSDRYSEQPSSAKSRKEERDVAAANETEATQMTFDHQITQPMPVPSEASKEAQEGGEDTIQPKQEKQLPSAYQPSQPPQKLLGSVPAKKSSTDSSGKVDPLKQANDVAPAEHKIASSETIPSVGSRKDEANVDDAEQIKLAQISMGPPDIQNAPDGNLSKKSVSNQEQVYNAQYDSQPGDGSHPNVHSASVEENAVVPPSQAQISDERRDSMPTRLDVKAASDYQSTTKSITDQGAQQQQLPAKIEPPPRLYETVNYSDKTLDKSKTSEPPSVDKEVVPPKFVPPSAQDPQRVTVPDGVTPDEHKNVMADLTPRQPSLPSESTKEETVVDASDQTKASQTIIGQRDISPAVSKEKYPSPDVQNDHLKEDQHINGSTPSQVPVPNVEPTADTRDGAFSDSHGANVDEPITHITGLTSAPNIQHEQDSDRYSEQLSSAQSREEQRDVAAADEAKVKETTFDHQRTVPALVQSEALKEAREGGKDTARSHEQEKQPPSENQSSLPPEKLLGSVPAKTSSTDGASGKVDPLRQDNEVAPDEHKSAPSETIPSIGSRKEEAIVDETEQIKPPQISMDPPDIQNAPDEYLREKSVSNQEQVYNTEYGSQPHDGSPPNVHSAKVEENATVPPSQAWRSDERRDSMPTRLDVKAASDDQWTTKSITDQGPQQQQLHANIEPRPPLYETVNYSDKTLDKSKPSEPPSVDKEVMPPKLVLPSARDPQHVTVPDGVTPDEHKDAMADLTPRQPSLPAEPTKEATVVDASDQTKASLNQVQGLGSYSEGSATDETEKAPMMSSPPAADAPQGTDPVRPLQEASLDFSSHEKTTAFQDGQANNVPNVSPTVSTSQVVSRSVNGAETKVFSEETVPSKSQENSKGASTKEIPEQQQKTDLSRTKSSRDDIKEANGVGANISATPGDIQSSTSKGSAEVTEGARNQPNVYQASVQSPPDSKEQVEETEEQDTGTGESERTNSQKNMNQMNNGTSLGEALDQSGKQGSGVQPIGSDKNNLSESTKDTSIGIPTYNKSEKNSVTSAESTQQLQAKDDTQVEETKTPASGTDQPKEIDPQANEPPSVDDVIMSPTVSPDEQKNAMADLTRSTEPPSSADPTKEETVVNASDQAKASERIINQEGMTHATEHASRQTLEMFSTGNLIDNPVAGQEHGSFSEESTTDSHGAITDEKAATSTSGHEKGSDASVWTATLDVHPPTVRSLPENGTLPPASRQNAYVEASGEAKSIDQEDMKPMAGLALARDDQRGTARDELALVEQKSIVSDQDSTHSSQKPSTIEPRENDISGSATDKQMVPQAKFGDQITPASDVSLPLREVQEASQVDPHANELEKPPMVNQDQASHDGGSSEQRNGQITNVHDANVDEKMQVPSSKAQDSTESITDQGAQQRQLPAKIEPPPPLFETRNYSDETLDKSKPSEPPPVDKEVMPPKLVPASAQDPQPMIDGVTPDEHKNAMADLTPRQPSLPAEPTKEETIVDASDQTKASLNQVRGLGSFTEGSATDETVKAPKMSSPPAPDAPQDMDPVQPPGEASLDFSSDEKTTVSQDGQPNNLPNASPSFSASQVVDRSEKGADTEAPSEEMAPSNSQENNKGTSIEKISKQQQQTDLSRTKSFRDDIKEANGVGANISATPGEIQASPSKGNVEVTEESRNQQNTSQAFVQSPQDNKEQVEETKEQNTGTSELDKVNLQKNMNQMNNGTSQEETLDQSGKQASGVQPIGSDKNNVSESTKDTSSGTQTYSKPEKSLVTSEEYTQQLQAKYNSQGEETETPVSETEQPKERDPQANSNRDISSQSQAQASDISEGQTSSTEDMNGYSRKTDGSTNDTTPGDTEDNPSI